MAVTVGPPPASPESGGEAAPPPVRPTGPPTLTLSTANCTVPVGVPAPGPRAVIVTEKVTGWPTTEGFGAATTVDVVEAWLTVWLVDPWLELKSLVPQSKPKPTALHLGMQVPLKPRRQ